MRAREPTSEPTALPRSVVGHAAGCGLRCICSRVLLPRLLLLRFRQQFGRVRLQGLRFLLLCKRIIICSSGRLCCTARCTTPCTFSSPLLCRSGLEHLAHDSTMPAQGWLLEAMCQASRTRMLMQLQEFAIKCLVARRCSADACTSTLAESADGESRHVLYMMCT
jgi:hypothetical protein